MHVKNDTVVFKAHEEERVLFYSFRLGYGAMTSVFDLNSVGQCVAHSRAFFFKLSHSNHLTSVLCALILPDDALQKHATFPFINAADLPYVETRVLHTDADLNSCTIQPYGSDAHGPLFYIKDTLWMIK